MTIAPESDSHDETCLKHGEQTLPESESDSINILLVDDEPKNLTVLETILDDTGYRLVRAQSADDALLALVREEFALIILDIQMPGMSGFELAQMVKQRKKTAGVPIIFLTAYYSEAEHVLEGYGSGAVDYLHKPVNPAILRSKVAVFAALHRTARELERANSALLVEVAERRSVEAQLLQLNNELEQRVEQRTCDLIRANKAIGDSEELLRLAQEAGRVGIWEWNLTTGSGIWTPAAWAIFDATGQQDEVTYPKWLRCVHPEDRERAAKAVEDAKANGNYWDEVRVNCGPAETKWIELVGAVEYDNDGPSRMRGAVRDITDRKAIELELKEAHRRKDEFLAVLAHELRNPLAPIHNALQIMRLTENDQQRFSEVREIMERQLVQMIRLVDDLLDVSRISTGKIELRLEQLEIGDVLKSAIETSAPLIGRSNHKLIVEIPETTPLRVLGDFIRLTQVFSNLLNNAAKYTPEEGQIRLNVTRDHDYAVISLKDSGIGIPAAMLPFIFDMFSQIDRSLDRAQGGLGIGLSLVRKLVTLHGGSVSASSPGDGLGSEFVVRIPLSSAPHNPGCAAK
ncbi:MAG: luxQ 12 [Planctomycetaceae bacterium]|nr:luxQ 12 [Planctomycetaceae bacterium]